jgi:hypothetical protein
LVTDRSCSREKGKAKEKEKEQMNLKQFLKPDWRKIVIMLIFLGLSFLYYHEVGATNVIMVNHGAPLNYFEIAYIRNSGGVEGLPPTFEIIYFGLIIDLIIWYILSCFIVWIYDKIKKKK